jgi:hypothetical protein
MIYVRKLIEEKKDIVNVLIVVDMAVLGKKST